MGEQRPVDWRVGLSRSITPGGSEVLVISSASISVSKVPGTVLEGVSRSMPVQAPVHPAKDAPPSSEISPEHWPGLLTVCAELPLGRAPLENFTANPRKTAPAGIVVSGGKTVSFSAKNPPVRGG